MEKIDRALDDLKQGKFILVYDNEKREGETDFVIASQFVTPNAIKRMRKDGGGLIFLMTSHQVAQHVDLPFLTDLYISVYKQYPIIKALVPNDIPYDTKSSFSLYINHRETFTGITDNDRSLTMKRFAELLPTIQNKTQVQAIKTFGKEFRSPGHIPICVAAEHLLDERRGHTELVIALLEMAGLTPAGSGCEIMGENGRALSKEAVIDYATQNGLLFLEGKEIIRAWKQWS
ncbi:MAG: 3,4-dihydroxy-2-butanone-4-phosphate synthase [Methanobacteriota archaeon]